MSFSDFNSESSAGHRTNRCSVGKYDVEVSDFGSRSLRIHEQVREPVERAPNRLRIKCLRTLFFIEQEISFSTGNENSFLASEFLEITCQTSVVHVPVIYRTITNEFAPHNFQW